MPAWWPGEIEPLSVCPAGYFRQLNCHGELFSGVPYHWAVRTIDLPGQWIDGAIELDDKLRIVNYEQKRLSKLVALEGLEQKSHQCQIKTNGKAVEIEVNYSSGRVDNKTRPDLDIDLAAVMSLVGDKGKWHYLTLGSEDNPEQINRLIYLDGYGQLIGTVSV